MIHPMLANVVWPELYMHGYYYSWWAVALGLLIEAAVLQGLFRRGPGLSLWMAFAANAISAIVGVFAMPLIALGWEYLLSITVYVVVNVGTFNPFAWAFTCLMVALVSCTIEWWSLRWIFKIPGSKRNFWIFYAANLVTAAIALACALIAPPKL